ncbi:MAG: serine/threonine protein kinase [Acidobacteriota bacterium]|nr:serine/threonine protein kinase [Acidobacteriota bacterium]
MTTRKIGKYEIAEQIGVGGFGAVFRARDPFIKRTVAIKTCSLNDEEIRSRFFREAELAGNLHHRHITTIYDFGVEEGVPYIVQEFLTGEDLDKVVKRGDDLPIARKLEILMAIAEGLDYAHRNSIIHRDIKPSNIRILDDGAVKIMDFGIAKSLLSESSLTQTGITLGTSAYLAPEQIRGEKLDQRTDIFALGVLAFELLTNRKPFRGEHLSTVLYKILNETPDPVHAIVPDCPPALSQIVSIAMDKDIEHRYPSMEAFRNDLGTVYRQLSGATGRFATSPTPMLARATSNTGSTEAIDPDATIRTPSKGMQRGVPPPSPPLPTISPQVRITPPSGALARVRATAMDDHTPTEIHARTSAAGGDVLHFEDPADRTMHRTPDPIAAASTKPSRLPVLAGVAVAVLAAAGIVWKLSSGAPRQAVQALPAPAAVPTAPLAFPKPQLGRDAAPTALAPSPLAGQAGAPPVAAAPNPAPAPAEPARPARKFRIQFSSIPESTLFVDGKRIGSSIPAKSVELSEGEHTVRFEKQGLPTYEKEFKVGSNGSPPIAYRFSIGYLTISAPAWNGATVLVDSKFQGVLSGSLDLPLSAGTHKITLSRDGLQPVTAEVEIPQGEKKTWTPPPPAARAEGSS